MVSSVKSCRPATASGWIAHDLPRCRDEGSRAACQAGLTGSVRPLGNHSSGTPPAHALEAPTQCIFAFSTSPALPPTIPQRPDASYSQPPVPYSAITKPARWCGLVHRSVSSACGPNGNPFPQQRRPQAEETSIDSASRRDQNPLKTNAQRHSHTRIPLAAMLYSRRVIQHAGSLSNRFPLRPVDCPTALSFDLCSPSSQSVARTGGNRLCPLPSAGFRWLLQVALLILKAKLGLFVQIQAPRQMHNSAQIRPIVHNRAQPARAPWTRFPRSENGGPGGRAQRAARPRACPA